jgi:hypothetical protein
MNKTVCPFLLIALALVSAITGCCPARRASSLTIKSSQPEEPQLGAISPVQVRGARVQRPPGCIGDESRARVVLYRDALLRPEMLFVTVADSDSVWRFTPDRLIPDSHRIGFFSIPEIKTNNSGTSTVTFAFKDGQGHVVSQGSISLGLSPGWGWDIGLRRDSTNPLSSCFGCGGARAFPIVNRAYVETGRDSLYMFWGGNCIVNPMVY